VDGNESRHGGHGEKMHPARAFVAAHQRRQFLELHRLPDRQAGQDKRNSKQDDHEVGGLLQWVIEPQLMGDPAMQQIGEFMQDRVQGEGEETAPVVAGEDTIQHIGQAVDDQQPHRGEVPLQRSREPAAQSQVGRKGKGEQRRGVVDAPAAEDHDEYRNDVNPVADAHNQGMDGGVRHAGRFGDAGAHGCLPGGAGFQGLILKIRSWLRKRQTKCIIHCRRFAQKKALAGRQGLFDL
jgi:hypothetical protein